jgi:predicted dehydrogenase
LFLHGEFRTNGYRQVMLGPEHPYLASGLAMDAPGVGFGQNDAFAYQARAFLEEVAGIDEASSLPRCASFAHGLHNMELLAAVVESAASGGPYAPVPAAKVTRQPSTNNEV